MNSRKIGNRYIYISVIFSQTPFIIDFIINDIGFDLEPDVIKAIKVVEKDEGIFKYIIYSKDINDPIVGVVAYSPISNSTPIVYIKKDFRGLGYFDFFIDSIVGKSNIKPSDFKSESQLFFV